MRLTKVEKRALHGLLSVVLNDPEFADAAAIDEDEWEALGRVADKAVADL